MTQANGHARNRLEAEFADLPNPSCKLGSAYMDYLHALDRQEDFRIKVLRHQSLREETEKLIRGTVVRAIYAGIHEGQSFGDIQGDLRCFSGYTAEDHRRIASEIPLSVLAAPLGRLSQPAG